jgi:hypothetical protein
MRQVLKVDRTSGKVLPRICGKFVDKRFPAELVVESGVTMVMSCGDFVELGLGIKGLFHSFEHALNDKQSGIEKRS